MYKKGSPSSEIHLSSISITDCLIERQRLMDEFLWKRNTQFLSLNENFHRHIKGNILTRTHVTKAVFKYKYLTCG
ncbi:CLUMA_CG017449, isoform A [Clunio marinus]|uniref:CLUMA_CG017449, isoform A n=1 Tax=Clunio marinus TaxID=568069 RepID=A0A1J1IXR1_9DIPT|nr:CLUMA_CG017449, isoform A [Clunio marinus]